MFLMAGIISLFEEPMILEAMQKLYLRNHIVNKGAPAYFKQVYTCRGESWETDQVLLNTWDGWTFVLFSEMPQLDSETIYTVLYRYSGGRWVLDDQHVTCVARGYGQPKLKIVEIEYPPESIPERRIEITAKVKNMGSTSAYGALAVAKESAMWYIVNPGEAKVFRETVNMPLDGVVPVKLERSYFETWIIDDERVLHITPSFPEPPPSPPPPGIPPHYLRIGAAVAAVSAVALILARKRRKT